MKLLVYEWLAIVQWAPLLRRKSSTNKYWVHKVLGVELDNFEMGQPDHCSAGNSDKSPTEKDIWAQYQLKAVNIIVWCLQNLLIKTAYATNVSSTTISKYFIKNYYFYTHRSPLRHKLLIPNCLKMMHLHLFHLHYVCYHPFFPSFWCTFLNAIEGL